MARRRKEEKKREEREAREEEKEEMEEKYVLSEGMWYLGLNTAEGEMDIGVYREGDIL